MKKGGWSHFFHYEKSYTGVFWDLGKCFAILKLCAHFNNPGRHGKECTLYVLLKWLQFFLNQAKLFEYWKLSELPWLLCFGYRISFVLFRLCFCWGTERYTIQHRVEFRIAYKLAFLGKISTVYEIMYNLQMSKMFCSLVILWTGILQLTFEGNTVNWAKVWEKKDNFY